MGKSEKTVKTALQLWSVHDKTEKNFLDTISRIAEMGYEGVEFAGFFDTPADKLKNHLDSLGIKAAGAHIGLSAIKEDLNGIIEYNKTIGNKYIVCPSSNAKTKEEYENLNKEMLEISAVFKENGLVLGYHNHSGELEKFGEKYAFDIIVGENTDIIYETDVFWTENAGIDTLEFLKRIGERCPLIHMKDMKIQPDGSFEDIPFGEGALKHKEIIKTALEYSRPEWFIVEWEGFGSCDSFEAAEKSIVNLKNMLN